MKAYKRTTRSPADFLLVESSNHVEKVSGRAFRFLARRRRILGNALPASRFLIQEQLLLRRIVQWCRGGLVIKAHRPVYHSTLSSLLIKTKKKSDQQSVSLSVRPYSRRCASCITVPKSYLTMSKRSALTARGAYLTTPAKPRYLAAQGAVHSCNRFGFRDVETYKRATQQALQWS